MSWMSRLYETYEKNIGKEGKGDTPLTPLAHMYANAQLQVTLDAEGNLVPTMAERWDVSDDGLTYTFYLRDAQWSNGTPVTAADFEYSWKRNVDPATASNYNYEAVTAGIKNAEAIINGEMASSELGVTAKDDKTLVVELDHIVPFFTAMLIRCSFMPLNQELFGFRTTEPVGISDRLPLYSFWVSLSTLSS